MQIRQGKNKRNSGVSVPLFTGITGVNEHIELVFNAVLSNAVVMLRSRDKARCNNHMINSQLLNLVHSLVIYIGLHGYAAVLVVVSLPFSAS